MALSGRDKRHLTSMQNSKLLKIFIVCICVFVAFMLGFFVRGSEPILSRLGFDSLVASTDPEVGTDTSNTYDSIAARVAEIETILKEESLDSYDLEEVTAAVLDAYVGTTDDSALRYYSPSRYSAYVKESNNKHAGVGVLFSEYEGSAYVVDVFEGSAAAAAGVQQGDFVVAVDGDRSQGWSATEAINALTRDEGESVIVTWRRPSTLEAQGGEEFTTTLICSTAQPENVITESNKGVGYIKLKQLTQNASELVARAIQDLDAQGVSSYVLDLRNNPGGYLTQAVDVASLFVKSGVIVDVETAEGSSPKLASGKIATDKPLTVITNENTSAAAEVLAGALQDSGRAQLIGARTMGKGSVQVTRPLTFGGALRYTAGYYKTPLGKSIQGNGISPDITVGQNDEVADDEQKEYAQEMARSLATF